MHNLRVKKTLHGLVVNVCDEVSRSQARFKCWAVIVHISDDVLQGIHIRLSDVHPDGTEAEAEPSGSSFQHDGGIEVADE